ncbi:hypothetical protein P4C99_22315, partial [Pontiellaceae bacterium B1224]|nr:hypothetical protein [Pontiellaceae bacterium B1224]
KTGRTSTSSLRGQRPFGLGKVSFPRNSRVTFGKKWRRDYYESHMHFTFDRAPSHGKYIRTKTKKHSLLIFSIQATVLDSKLEVGIFNS